METVSASFASKRTKIVQDSERQLLQSGVITSLRFSFAFFGVNECNGDVTSTDQAIRAPQVRLLVKTVNQLVSYQVGSGLLPG
jgi:hypothetical protein